MKLTVRELCEMLKKKYGEHSLNSIEIVSDGSGAIKNEEGNEIHIFKDVKHLKQILSE